MQVQAELVRRRIVHVSPTGKKRSFSCNHCFAQMVFCGDCGELYRRVHWNNHSCKSIVWRCISRLEPISAEKNCTNRTVNELLLQEITINAIHQILTERDIFLKTLQQNYFLSSALKIKMIATINVRMSDSGIEYKTPSSPKKRGSSRANPTPNTISRTIDKTVDSAAFPIA